MMRLKPWLIWTVVIICLLVTFVGLALMLFAVFHHSGTDGLHKTGALMAALPLLFLLVFVQQCTGLLWEGAAVKLASRTGRLLIWGIVMLLLFGTLLAVVWVLGAEGRERVVSCSENNMYRAVAPYESSSFGLLESVLLGDVPGMWGENRRQLPVTLTPHSCPQAPDSTGTSRRESALGTAPSGTKANQHSRTRKTRERVSCSYDLQNSGRFRSGLSPAALAPCTPRRHIRAVPCGRSEMPQPSGGGCWHQLGVDKAGCSSGLRQRGHGRIPASRVLDHDQIGGPDDRHGCQRTGNGPAVYKTESRMS